MSADGQMVDPVVSEAFSEIAKLEKDFATVELDSMRQKEYSLKELYDRRSKQFAVIPGFWPVVFGHGPEDLQAVLGPKDGRIIDSLTSFKVERYQIKSDTEGDPRSLRFTFEFDPSKNPYFEDRIVTKDFEYVASGEDGPNGFVSKPVNFKWTKTGKKEGYHKTLDLAEQLYQAEQALVADRAKGTAKVPLEQKERESLWQYEKLREELEKQEENPDEGPSFLDFFGFRGVVGAKKEFAANGAVEEEDMDEDEDDEDDYALDVEIFPAGDEVAMALAEDLWENAMDYFMQGQAEEGILEEMEDDEDGEGSDAPDLVEAGDDFEGFDEDEKRPSKKQRRS